MPNFSCDVEFEAGEQWVERYFFVSPASPQNNRPIACLSENYLAGSGAELYARYRTVENGWGATAEVIALYVHLSKAADKSGVVRVNLFLEKADSFEPVPCGGFDGFTCRISSKNQKEYAPLRKGGRPAEKPAS